MTHQYYNIERWQLTNEESYGALINTVVHSERNKPLLISNKLRVRYRVFCGDGGAGAGGDNGKRKL